MNADIMSSGSLLLIGALLVLIAGILIGVTANSGQRQVLPTMVVERPRDSNGAGAVALVIMIVIAVLVIARVI